MQQAYNIKKLKTKTKMHKLAKKYRHACRRRPIDGDFTITNRSFATQP